MLCSCLMGVEEGWLAREKGVIDSLNPDPLRHFLDRSAFESDESLCSQVIIDSRQ